MLSNKSMMSYSLVLLAWVVMTVGAYTRLTDAGLGCPDWPGCYGQLIPTSATIDTELPTTTTSANLTKAWTEMFHRYLASCLGLLIILITLFQWYRRQNNIIYWLLSGLVGIQGLLGMWTVTWQLYPLVVLAHLLGGLSITSLLWYQTMPKTEQPQTKNHWPYYALTIGISLALLQIILGGWLSANYAALACTGFPTCNGFWWPPMDWQGLYISLPSMTTNYDGGILSAQARVGLHMLHRLGALFLATYCITLAIFLFKRPQKPATKRWLSLMLALLLLQIMLGILNVITLLPITIAVAHHAVATLFFLTLLRIQWQIKQHPPLGNST